MKHRALTIAGATFLVLTTTGISPSAQYAVSKLDSNHQPLAADFNRAGGTGRLVVVLSPT
ncbi:MAG TPA: hypothetical protein VLK65_15775 [Vicinamibacteria bacterium]|nr:hypothetical protein [Vicinamibacteria bacterium]